MKKPFMKKNAKNVLAISAALALLAGVLVTGIGKNGFASDDLSASQKQNDDHRIDEHGLIVKHVSTIDGDTDYPSKIFSYSVTPSNASREVTLAISWQDGTYTEDTKNYFETSIDTANCQITIKCIKAFDHVAVAKVTSIHDTSLFAEITLNYIQRFLGFQPYDSLKDGVMREETISKYVAPKDEESFMKMITTQSSAAFYPAFSEIYTKEYPGGHEAQITATYNKAKPYTADPLLGYEITMRYQAALNAVESETEGGVWRKQTSADLIEGLAKVYEKMSYADQRELNNAGYIGFKRLYTTKGYIDENAKDTWSSYWIIKVAVKDLRSYLADVTVTLEETNLDF